VDRGPRTVRSLLHALPRARSPGRSAAADARPRAGPDAPQARAADEALRSLDVLAGASVRPLEATRIAAEASLERGDPAQAERIAFAALAGHPQDGDLLDLLLRAQLALGQDGKALETIRRLLKAGGPDPATTGMLAELLVRTAGKLPESERPEAVRRLAEVTARLSGRDVREAAPAEALETTVRALMLAGRWDEASGSWTGRHPRRGTAGGRSRS